MPLQKTSTGAALTTMTQWVTARPALAEASLSALVAKIVTRLWRSLPVPVLMLVRCIFSNPSSNDARSCDFSTHHACDLCMFALIAHAMQPYNGAEGL